MSQIKKMMDVKDTYVSKGFTINPRKNQTYLEALKEEIEIRSEEAFWQHCDEVEKKEMK